MSVQKNIPPSLNPSQSQVQSKSTLPNQQKVTIIPQPEFAKLLKYHGDTIPMMVFNPNNKQLISCSLDKTILIWDLTNLKKLPKVGYGHTSLINDIAMAPNGNFLLLHHLTILSGSGLTQMIIPQKEKTYHVKYSE